MTDHQPVVIGTPADGGEYHPAWAKPFAPTCWRCGGDRLRIETILAGVEWRRCRTCGALDCRAPQAAVA